jgi:cytochrome c peroxidase
MGPLGREIRRSGPKIAGDRRHGGDPRGEVVSINNYYRLFKDILTPVQLDGLRLLLTPFPQEEFNATDDRKTAEPSLGVTCFDCHTNGHTSGAFHINPDTRPEQRRMRLDTVSLRGLFNQQIHGSKRSLRSVEDFTEFEQRTAYFNGDQIHAFKKGANILDRIQVSHMAQLQNMLDFPPAPKLTPLGRLDPAKATQSELRGEQLFFGKAQCGSCHPAPSYLDNQMHDLQLERFLKDEPGGRADQDLHAPRYQGQPAVPARRPLPHARRHRRVLQPRPGSQAHEGREARSGGVYEDAVIATASNIVAAGRAEARLPR